MFTGESIFGVTQLDRLGLSRHRVSRRFLSCNSFSNSVRFALYRHNLLSDSSHSFTWYFVRFRRLFGILSDTFLRICLSHCHLSVVIFPLEVEVMRVARLTRRIISDVINKRPVKVELNYPNDKVLIRRYHHG